MEIPGVEVPKVQLESQEQVVSYLEDLADAMTRSRYACDAPARVETGDTVKARQRMMWTFLTKQGQLIGALNAFALTGMISERAYAEFHQRAIMSLAPTVVNWHPEGGAM